jgi:hypothetical protein
MWTTKDLDRMAAKGCQDPTCGHTDHDATIFLNARCHMDGALDISYELNSGVLQLACRECGKTIAAIKVARR